VRERCTGGGGTCGGERGEGRGLGFIGVLCLGHKVGVTRHTLRPRRDTAEER